MSSGAMAVVFAATFFALEGAKAFGPTRTRTHYHQGVRSTQVWSTVDEETASSTSPSSGASSIVDDFIENYKGAINEGHEWSKEFGFAGDGDEEVAEGAFYALFKAIRELDAGTFGLSGTPFYVPSDAFAKAESRDKGALTGYFHFTPELSAALEEDFLDAQVGSTDNRKGWTVNAVSVPSGSSFEEARMTLEQVKSALEVGTVIFNNIGAHIPKLAGPTLACTDAMNLPGAVNMYCTARGMRTSAPPHTDRQDVVVVQMEGAKRWRVFTPPTDGNVKPSADPFARGKGEDSLPLHTLLEGKESRLGSELLMDVVTREGDVLFIPAGFPHTTDTVEETDADYETSLHLTFNIDTHVWNLDNLNVRNIALKRAGFKDLLQSPRGETNLYTGPVNQLSQGLRSSMMDALPLNFLDAGPSSSVDDKLVNFIAGLCTDVSEVTGDSANKLTPSLIREALERIHSFGATVLDIHRDMYLAAIEEGRLRTSEAAMTAHVSSGKKTLITPERMQRLSLFRVRPFFEKLDAAKKELAAWSLEGGALIDDSSSNGAKLDPNWQFTAQLKVGDEVEADLGGAFFEAKVSRVAGSFFDVIFFDGDRADGLERSQIKLLKPPVIAEDDFDTTGMTAKEIKKMRKKLEKKRRK